MKRRTLLTTVLAAPFAGAGPVWAQTYPTGPVRVVVPYAAGGGLDAVTRMLAEALAQRLGQAFNVDNRAGGGGMIGADLVAKAAPDGQTLLMSGNPELTITPSVAGRAPYTATTDFAPIVLVAQSPNVLVANASLGAKTLREAVDAARRDKRSITIGTPGNGSPQHIAVVVLQSVLGMELTHVPYKGAGPATIAALGGEINMALVGAPPALAHIKSGKLMALAVTQPARSPLLPEVPTVGEALGVMADADFVTWYGLLAPARTPIAILQALERTVLAWLGTAEVQARMNKLGTDVVAAPSAQFGERLRHETKVYADIVKRHRIKAD